MADKKISELDAAAALVGTEEVPIVQSGETVRTTALAIAGLSSGAPGAPVNAVQFNNPLGSFDGDADFTWLSGTGLTIGGATETLGVVTPGVGGEHVAIGNYGVIDFVTFQPGDPTLESTTSGPAPFTVNEFVSGDLTALNENILTSSSGFKHIGVGTATTMSALYAQVAVNSDSTGPISLVNGLGFLALNNGSGPITGALIGVQGIVDHEGSGLAAYVVGGDFTIFPVGPTTNAIGAHLSIQFAGASVAHAYGLSIDDCSAIGTTASYNILSAGTSFITPASTVGGNLFQGHAAFGNYADVNTPYFAPGDPTNGGAFSNPTGIALSNFHSGDVSVSSPYVMAIWDGYKHTGITKGSVSMLDFEPTINSDSTGPFGSIYAFSAVPTNYGSGAIDNLIGTSFTTYNLGSGIVKNIYGGVFGVVASASAAVHTDLAIGGLFYVSVQGASGTIGEMIDGAFGDIAQGVGTSLTTTRKGLLVYTVPGTSVNNYGLYLEDQSATGSSVSENIHSAGASSLTKFEGHHYQGNYYETTEVTAPSAPPANGVRIYAQDNGGGKTQLMALFNTGAAQQIAIQP